eukprot:9477393-Pyramimonas_sp.AAC.1
MSSKPSLEASSEPRARSRCLPRTAQGPLSLERSLQAPSSRTTSRAQEADVTPKPHGDASGAGCPPPPAAGAPAPNGAREPLRPTGADDEDAEQLALQRENVNEVSEDVLKVPATDQRAGVEQMPKPQHSSPKLLRGGPPPRMVRQLKADERWRVGRR